MKRFFLGLLLLLCVTFGVSGQAFDYGNSWYAPAQQYLKFLVTEDGLYRVNSSDLIAAGFDTTGINPYYFHLMYRGKEEPLHIEYAGSNWTFLEFYGLRNDGRIDSLLYRDDNVGHLPYGDLSPNTRLNLFSDTSAYFLTWNNLPGIRYLEIDSTLYPPTPETYFRYTSLVQFPPNPGGAYTEYTLGGGSRYDIYESLNSDYIPGEGYLGPEYDYPNPYTDNLPTPFPANVGNPSEFSVRLYHQSSNSHITEVKVAGNLMVRDTTFGISIRTFTAPYTPSLGTNNSIRFDALYYHPIYTDVNKVVWYSMTYDRLFDLGGANFIQMDKWNKGSYAYFRFQNADIISDGWVIDRKYNTRSHGTAAGSVFNVIVPGGVQPRDLIVATDKNIRTPLIDISPSLNHIGNTAEGAQFVIISHRALTNSAEAYYNYRDTCTVNPLSVKLVYVDEIYDEFGYGSLTPLAIKRFCKYAIDNWAVKPEYFFLWGKGCYQNRNGYETVNLVPTCGAPATDWNFVSDFSRDSVDIAPQAAIGRVNAYNDVQGMIYLDKVNEYEHSPWEPWMKESVMLGGGENIGEQKPIRDYLIYDYRPVYEAAPLGGRAWYYQNYNTGVITNSPSIGSKTRINGGVGLIHFFGHSSSNIYDVDIQEPDLYTNYGKYPFMVAFGCYGGDFTNQGSSFGERFITEEGKGSIGYLANSTAGYLGPLGVFGTYLYKYLYKDMVGQPVGKGLATTFSDVASDFKDQNFNNHTKQLNLQGDPAVSLYNPQKPDLAIDESSIYFDPPYFSASDTAFNMYVVTHNYGLATSDSFYLSVRQQLPGGTWITYPSTKHAPIAYLDTLRFRIVNNVGSAMAGLNYFDVFVDSTNLLDEYSESNNRILYQQVIQGNVPAILYPYDYAVIPDNDVTLSAAAYVISSTAALHYIFEIDTSADFNSPLWSSLGMSGVVTGSAVLAQWHVPFTLQDSMVYYWRVRIAEVLPAVWSTASFKYINGRTGWAQSRPPQYFRDPTTSITMDKINRVWKFDTWSRDMHMFGLPYLDANFKLSNGVYSSNLNSWGQNGVLHNNIDYRSLIPGAVGTSNGDWELDIFPDLETDLVSSIAATRKGDYYILAGNRNHGYPSWKKDTKTSLLQIGADTSKLSSLTANQSFYIIGRKGETPGSAQMLLEANLVDTATGLYKYDLFTYLTSQKQAGQIYSTTVGASLHWQELYWNWNQLDQWNADDVRVSVIAHHKDGHDSLVYANLGRGTYDLTTLDAELYPWLSLVADAKDSVYLTAPELKHWHVFFDPAPDAAIDPVARWSFVRDTVSEGASVTVTFNTRNLTDIPMDSLLIRYVVQREDRSLVEVGRVRYDSLLNLQEKEYSFTFNTGGKNLGGLCNFGIEINPDEDQPEQHHFNNLYSHNFLVIPDRLNPILDVTFDGKHLMDGDIVSPAAEILIQINDENEFLAVNDTAFEIYFGEGTSSFGLPRVFIQGNSRMETSPATLPENKAKLFFRPGPLADGDYTLQVQGYDFNGNPSGKTLYEIHFKVVNEVAVSNVVNYPNPFSTSTKFAYTLTGAEMPEMFELQIFTITGKLVKVIDLLEMGEIRTGYNITEYAWDGRDEYGDLLANGVYVYKVAVKSGGKDLKIRDEGISSFFDNGFGKMYIMR